MDFSYLNFEIDSIHKIKSVITDHKNLIGLNVTIPYKQSVIPFLDQLSKQAEDIGAVNTICIDRNEYHPRLIGHNTDGIGFNKSLDQFTDFFPKGALVLGSGGAARAVIYVLEKRGIRYLQVSRKPGGKKQTYKDIGAEMMNKYPLIINTTPMGMFPNVEDKPDIPYNLLGPEHTLIDLIYNPSQTQFLKLGEKAAARTMNGLPMLIAQAEASWELWNKMGNGEQE